MIRRTCGSSADIRLLTIYDLAVEARWEGKVGEEEVKGTVKVPEVSHEAIDGLSDYEVSHASTTSTILPYSRQAIIGQQLMEVHLLALFRLLFVGHSLALAR